MMFCDFQKKKKKNEVCEYYKQSKHISNFGKLLMYQICLVNSNLD